MLVSKTLALLTDFGFRDYYVAVVKGVLYRLFPEINIIDISHHLPRFSPQAATFFLEQTVPYLPDNSNGLVVIDPGVGGHRDLLLVKIDNQFWLGPDNGCLSYFIRKENSVVFCINNDLPFCINKRSSFEARDRMAPFMGRLLSGEDPGRWIKRVAKDTVKVFNKASSCETCGTYQGEIIHIDYFGNVITSFQASMVEKEKEKWELAHNNNVYVKWVGSYEDIIDGVGLLLGSHGYIELACKEASAAERFNLKIGDSIYMNKKNCKE